MNFRNLPNSQGQHWKSSEDFSSTLGQLRKSWADFGNVLDLFSCCKVKVNITSTKSVDNGRLGG